MAFDHVYIDMQSTLHQIIRRGDNAMHRAGGRHAVMGWRQAAGGGGCCRHWSAPLDLQHAPRPCLLCRTAARTKQYFHVLLHSRLDDILAATQPQQRVVLALDGPAPLAKLLEQRCVPAGAMHRNAMHACRFGCSEELH
jgi:hypothetical protein